MEKHYAHECYGPAVVSLTSTFFHKVNFTMSVFGKLPKSIQPPTEKPMISKFTRKRNIFAIVGSLVMIFLWLITDPDAGIITSMPVGAKILDIFTVLSKGIIYVLLLHFCRKYILDYVNFRMQMEKACETPEGAGSAAIATAIYTLAFSIVIFAATSGGVF